MVERRRINVKERLANKWATEETPQKNGSADQSVTPYIKNFASEISIYPLSKTVDQEVRELDEVDEFLNTPDDVAFAQEIEEETLSVQVLSENIDTTDPVSIYFHDISQFPLLTQEEEYELGLLAQNGDQEAIQKLINSNLRWGVAVARKYTNRGLSMLDLIQEANIGVMKAAEKYEPKKGRFTTYSAHWIKQRIHRAIDDQARTIRVPVYMNVDIRKMKRTKNLLRQELGREATPNELSMAMDVSQEKLETILSASQKVVSLHTPLSHDGDAELGDVIEDTSIMPLEDVAVITSNIDLLQETLAILKPNYRRIIELRFFERKTLAETGLEVGLTRERVRQIEAKSLLIMQQYLRDKGLMGSGKFESDFTYFGQSENPSKKSSGDETVFEIHPGWNTIDELIREQVIFEQQAQDSTNGFHGESSIELYRMQIATLNELEKEIYYHITLCRTQEEIAKHINKSFEYTRGRLIPAVYRKLDVTTIRECVEKGLVTGSISMDEPERLEIAESIRSSLTDSELETLRQIAQREDTKGHRNSPDATLISLKKKLGVPTKEKAVIKALAFGLITPDEVKQDE